MQTEQNQPPALGGELKCWSCKAEFNLQDRQKCDGCCWKCGVEIELDDYMAPLLVYRDQFKRMYNSASESLCAIGELLGVPEEDQSVSEVMSACRSLMADRDTLLADVKQLRGIQPDFPPRPPEGDGLPRYGLRWNGPQQPLATPMDDGYWTPWHLAEKLQSQLAEVVSAIRTLNYGPRHAKQLPSDDQPTYPQRQNWVEWILELCDKAEVTLKPKVQRE